MKLFAIATISMITAFLLGCAPDDRVSGNTVTNDWVLRKQSMSNVCHVQKSTAAPVGELVSEHNTRKEACQAAKGRYDGTFSDKSQCWSYGGGTATGCASEGVSLP